MPKAVLLLVLLAAIPSVATAQRAMRPDLGAPFGTEDAFPQENGVLQLQGTAEYDRSREGRDALELSPTLQWGVRPGVELRLAGRYTVGDDESANRGTIRPGVLLGLTEEQGWIPALAFIGDVDFPFGAGDERTALRLILAASRTTGRGPGNWGLHLNAGLLTRPDTGPEERRNRYRFSGAVVHVVAQDTSLIAEYVQEQQEPGEKDLLQLQGGLRHRLGSDTTLGLVAGAGLNRDSPRLSLRLGLEMNFNIGSR